MKLSTRLNRFPEYIFSKLARKVAQVEKQTNKPVLNLGIGNPDYPPSQKNIKQYQQYIKQNDAHFYPGYSGIDEFHQALKLWYKTRFKIEGHTLKQLKTLPLLGAKDGISHFHLAILDKQDEVLIPNPGYPTYEGNALLCGAQPVFYGLTTKHNFQPNTTQIEKLITTRTKMIWLNFPHNPTGATIDQPILEQLVTLAIKHQLIIAYDNAYSEITFNNYQAPSIFQIPQAHQVAIEFGSFSKTFSYAGFRLGWTIGNPQLITALAKVKSQFDSGLALPLQKLAAFSLNNFDQQWYQSMLADYEQRRQIIADKLTQLDLKFKLPKASLYIWAEIPQNYADSEQFAFELLKRKQILVTPGTAFGSNGQRYVRVSICSNINNMDQYFSS